MIVVAIMMILAALAVPNFQRARARARTAQCMSNLRALGTMLAMYVNDHNVYPPTLEYLLTLEFVRTSNSFYCSEENPDADAQYVYNYANIRADSVSEWVLSDDPFATEVAGATPTARGSRQHNAGEVTLILYGNGDVAHCQE